MAVPTRALAARLAILFVKQQRTSEVVECFGRTARLVTWSAEGEGYETTEVGSIYVGAGEGSG